MHLLLTLAGGVVLLGVFLLFGHLWGANAASIALAGKVFLPVWLAVSIANLWVGVNHAGYSVREELPILGIVFVAPAVMAALAIWYFSRPWTTRRDQGHETRSLPITRCCATAMDITRESLTRSCSSISSMSLR